MFWYSDVVLALILLFFINVRKRFKGNSEKMQSYDVEL